LAETVPLSQGEGMHTPTLTGVPQGHPVEALVGWAHCAYPWKDSVTQLLLPHVLVYKWPSMHSFPSPWNVLWEVS
jgi:hypothetical protein